MLISGLLAIILKTLAVLIHYVLVFYTWVILASVIISWVRPAPSNEIIRTILITVIKLTEPVFKWVRAKLPKAFLSTGLDLTPMIVLFALMAADMLVVESLFEIVHYLKEPAASNSFQNLQPFQQ
ncbi:MAG: YggT family protein [Deltaproteobacteria bacterium]|nr:YggT family protein [Deltaproteobacteria bacterium]